MRLMAVQRCGIKIRNAFKLYELNIAGGVEGQIDLVVIAPVDTPCSMLIGWMDAMLTLGSYLLHSRHLSHRRDFRYKHKATQSLLYKPANNALASSTLVCVNRSQPVEHKVLFDGLVGTT